ncbi:MAG TPA: circularly permuted type 2 ATP-grasp protein [Azospirillum sp.]
MAYPLHHGYPRPVGGCDEMMGADGAVRPYWEEFVEGLAALPAEEMNRRWERGQRLIADNGVTFHVHGDPQGLERPWQLDPMPLLLEAAEGRALAAGLEQRARLLNLILADLYGERRLVRDGLLPPTLVFGHPGYLRACHGIAPAAGIFLHLYAADLARTRDGGWTVVGDRTDAPAGVGYALENRLITTRILSEFFRSSRVHWLMPFVQVLRDTLLSLSPRRFDAPRLVLLSPGGVGGGSFEHAYLARLLGCPLVESEDLTVRDDRVLLKTLDGLQPVDVILRHMPAHLCDPLELDSRSDLGVAGMVQAVRAGAVTIANALGCGVLETPALAAFLPRLARDMLGEPLKLPSVRTWWCGDEAARGHVLANLGRLTIRSAYDSRAPAIFGDTLAAAEREDLAARIAARPHAYVAQDPVIPSTAPVWVDGRLVPQPMVLRTFLVAQGDGYRAMPGGLARASSARDLPNASLQGGGEGGSKDTWVLSDAPEPPKRTTPPVAAPVRLVRGGRDLPSRVADNMFWFGRYLERGEGITRMLRTIYVQVEESASGLAGAGGETLAPHGGILSLLGLHPTRAQAGTVVDAAALLGRQQFDPSYRTGLVANMDRLLRVATRVRDRLSLDTWRNVQQLNTAAHRLKPAMAADVGEVLGALNGLILMLEASSGLVLENMTRGLGWRFLEIGRRMERASHLIDLLSGVLQLRGGDLPVALDALLTVSDSGMTYRSRYFPTPQFAPALDLLLCDDANPRSVAFQFAALADHVGRLVAFHEAARIRPEQRLMIFLEGSVRTADIDVLAAPDEDGRYSHLGKLLEVLQARLWELSETLSREYFAHAGSPSARQREWRM